MSRFAKINEDVFRRNQELTGGEYRLYSAIVFHTFVDTGVCRRSLRQIALTHGMEYTRTTSRFKKLVKLGWCEKTEKGIRPLVNSNVDKTPTSPDLVLAKSQHQSLQNANTDIDEMPTSEDEMFAKSQHTYKGIIEPFKDQNFSRVVAAEKSAAAAAEKNGHKSKFSIEECLRYAQICVERGEPVTNPHGLVTMAYQTGEHDVFIQARLYPEKPETIPPATAAGGISDKRREALGYLIEMKTEGLDFSGLQQFYVDDWEWLMRELENR